jgi:DNA modification methylase
MSLAERIKEEISKLGTFNLAALYELFPEEEETTIRGRVYRELIGQGIVRRVSKGLYTFTGEDGEEGVIIQGDARDLSMIQDESLDLVVADHPYKIAQGTNRKFNDHYAETTFEYTQEDFNEKARVLKAGAFLVEFLPEMKGDNVDYIFEVINMARKAGFKFYTKVPWYKAEVRDGRLVDGSAFVGRKAVMEDVYIFSKGNPRKLRLRKQGQAVQLEQGAAEMFPAVFMVPPVSNQKRVHKAQKPERMISKIIKALSKEGETVLDQFAGSMVTFFAALKLKRRAIAIEWDQANIDKALEGKVGA